MNKSLLIFLLFIMLPFCFSLDFTTISKEGNYIKTNIENKEIYTTSNFKNAPYFIGTDKSFYSLKNNEAMIKIYVASNLPKDSKIGISINDKPVFLKGIIIDGKIIDSSKFKDEAKNFLIDEIIKSKNQLTEITLIIQADYKVIGLGTKFNIYMTDSNNNKQAEFDPYLSGFSNRYPINIGSTHSAIGTNYTFFVKNIDSSAWTCDTNNGNLAIASQHTGTPYEIDAQIQGTCGKSTDLNIVFKSQFGIPANTALNASDTNGYYVYITDINRSNSKRDYNSVYLVFFDAETNYTVGNLAGQNRWVKDSGTGQIQILKSDADCLGHYCANGVPDGTQQHTAIMFPSITRGFLKAQIKINITSADGAGVLKLWQDDNVTNAISIWMRKGTSTVDNAVPFTEATPVNAWRRYEADFNTTSQAVKIMDGTNAGETIGRGNTPANIGKLDFWSIDNGTAGNYYFDNVLLYETLSVEPSVTLGTKQTLSLPADFNFTNFYSYSQYKGGQTLNIPFRITDPDNNSLLIDLNYSAVTTQGTGTAIINDINSMTLNCDSNNLSIGANCSYSWTVASTDGNYYLLGSADDGTNLDFNVTNSNFLIDSNAPTLFNQQPPTTYDKNVLPFDFNVSITDGNGSGVLRCIARYYKNSVAQSDTNVNSSTGSCAYSFNDGSISCGTKVKIGWYGVDNVQNISPELATADINYSCITPTPPTPTPKKSTPVRYFNRTQKQDLTTNEKNTVNFQNTIVLYGTIALILLAIIGAMLWKKRQ